METVKILVERVNSGQYIATSRDQYGDVAIARHSVRRIAVETCKQKTDSILSDKVNDYVVQDMGGDEC